MKQNKFLGQHWLYDKGVLDEVVHAAGINEGDTVLEVGPGLGTLTRRLLKAKAQVIAVEKDELLADQLAKNSQVTVVSEDILKYDLNLIPPGYKVAANIPYYLSSNLLRMFLEASNQPRQLGLLVQKEVAERMAAKPGQMNILAFAVQYFAEVELCSVVPAQMFDPPPKVDSQIVSLKVRSKPLFTAARPKIFRLVRAGFGEKRKKLANSLAGGLQIEKSELMQILDQLGFHENVRAQELAHADWKRLYKQLESRL